MIGYVRAYKPEMKFKDYELYKGVYCSLCKQLGKRYGIIARLILSYDFTFFALVRMATRESCTKMSTSRCSFNPMKKCIDCGRDNVDIAYTADVSVLTMYHKLKDNIDDSKFFKRLLCRMLLPFAKLKYKKACANQPEMAKMMEMQMNRQIQLEKKDCSVDESADPSARMLSELLAYNIDCGNINSLKMLGYFIGRWVYLIDAVDDVEDDIKNGGFNPLKEKFNGEDFSEYATQMLSLTVGEAINNYDNLKIFRFNDIITNVLFDGMRCVMNKVLNKEECRNEKSV